MQDFQKVLEDNIDVFHRTRDAKHLYNHWLLLRHYHLLSCQSGMTSVQAGYFPFPMCIIITQTPEQKVFFTHSAKFCFIVIILISLISTKSKDAIFNNFFL